MKITQHSIETNIQTNLVVGKGKPLELVYSDLKSFKEANDLATTGLPNLGVMFMEDNEEDDRKYVLQVQPILIGNTFDLNLGNKEDYGHTRGGSWHYLASLDLYSYFWRID